MTLTPDEQYRVDERTAIMEDGGMPLAQAEVRALAEVLDSRRGQGSMEFGAILTA